MSEAPEIVRAWPATVWVTGPLSAVKVLQCAQAATPILARSRKTEVVRTGDWVAKRSRAPFGVGAIRLTAAPVRRRRGFEAARYLNARGVSVPAVAGYVEWSYFGVVVRNALVMEFLEGYEPIRDYAQSIAGDVSAAERLLDRLADAVVSIDRARAYHSDLAVKNVMVRDDRIVFIDMDAVRIEYDQTDFDRQRNCVQLLDGFYSGRNGCSLRSRSESHGRSSTRRSGSRTLWLGLASGLKNGGNSKSSPFHESTRTFSASDAIEGWRLRHASSAAGRWNTRKSRPAK